MKYIDDSSSYDYSKEDYKDSLEQFDPDRKGLADIDDIKRVLRTYSTLEEAEIEHFLKINLVETVEGDTELENATSINIKDSIKTMFSA